MKNREKLISKKQKGELEKNLITLEQLSERRQFLDKNFNNLLNDICEIKYYFHLILFGEEKSLLNNINVCRGLINECHYNFKKLLSDSQPFRSK